MHCSACVCMFMCVCVYVCVVCVVCVLYFCVISPLIILCLFLLQDEQIRTTPVLFASTEKVKVGKEVTFIIKNIYL